MITDSETIYARAGEIEYYRQVGYNARCGYDRHGRLLLVEQFGPIAPWEWEDIHRAYDYETTAFDYGIEFDGIPR